jgi:hypothetical protein
MDALGARDADPDPIPPDIVATYSRRLRSLWDLPTRYDDHGEIIATPLTFSFPARDAITEFLREIEPRLGSDGDLHPFTDWAGKLAGAAVRFSGVLHMAELAGTGDDPTCQIERPAVEHGIILARYFLEHAVIAFQAMRADETIDNAADVLVWIKKQARAGNMTFSVREAHHARQHRFKTVADVVPALDFLEDHSWIRPVAGVATPRSGRSPSPRYEVHPKAAR